jgi:hypothetical protein
VRDIKEIASLLEELEEENLLLLVFGSLMCADNNITPEKESDNDKILNDFLSAINNMTTPSEAMLKAKNQITFYLKCRADGEIGGVMKVDNCNVGSNLEGVFAWKQ